MIIVTGELRVAPEKMERLRPHMRTVIKANRREDGCLLFAFGEDVLDPGLIRIVERWRDWEALATHDKAPHVVTWRAALKEIGIISRDLMAHEATAGRAIALRSQLHQHMIGSGLGPVGFRVDLRQQD